MLLFLFLAFSTFLEGAFAGMLPSKQALTVDKTVIYADSSFTKPSKDLFKSGEILEILAQSEVEHPDLNKKQQFYWFKVQSKNNKTGWIFGDRLAIMQNNEQIELAAKKLHQQQKLLGADYNNVEIWVAAIEGHDTEEFHEGVYSETYLIVSNPKGRNHFIRIGKESFQGEINLKQLNFLDFTNDGYVEIIFEMASSDHSERFESRNLEIYSLQNGGLIQIFDENLTLLGADLMPTPCLYKCVEIDDKTIRIEYLDFVSSDKYSLSYPHDVQSQTQEECVEFVTYTYLWSNRNHKVELLYEPSRTAPNVTPLNYGVSVRSTPAVSGEVISILNEGDKLLVIKQFDKLSKDYRGELQAEAYLYVRTPDKKFGYVAASKVNWVRLKQAQILEAYAKNTPLLKMNWRYDFDFVRVIEKE
jgi:uncharacterized protein YgiM (DUF1202 family)